MSKILQECPTGVNSWIGGSTSVLRIHLDDISACFYLYRSNVLSTLQNYYRLEYTKEGLLYQMTYPGTTAPSFDICAYFSLAVMTMACVHTFSLPHASSSQRIITTFVSWNRCILNTQNWGGHKVKNFDFRNRGGGGHTFISGNGGGVILRFFKLVGGSYSGNRDPKKSNQPPQLLNNDRSKLW